MIDIENGLSNNSNQICSTDKHRSMKKDTQNRRSKDKNIQCHSTNQNNPDHIDKLRAHIQKLGLALDESSKRNIQQKKDGKLSYKEQREPLLTKRAQGRNISGLSAYE